MKKSKWKASVRGIAAVAAMVVSIAGMLGFTGAGAAKAAAKEYRIVALGDSLTVGYEPGMTTASVPYGYADRVYEQALFRGRAKLDNYGILGLRTEGLNRLLEGAAAGSALKGADLQEFPADADARILTMADTVARRTAELRKSLGSADLVVMTIGANDFTGYLQSLMNGTVDDAAKSLDEEYMNRVNKYTEEAAGMLRKAAALAPHAQIVITDQYLPLPKLFKPELYDMLYEKAVAPLTAAVDEMTAKLRAEGMKVYAVHIANKFAGQEGSMTYMAVSLFGEETKPDIHPRQDGYAAIGKAFAEVVWGQYKKPAVRPAAVPISVVVGGKELLTANKPAMKGGSTFVALGDIVKAMGSKVTWTAKTKTAVFEKNGRKVTLVIGAKTMTVNGVKVKLDAPAYLKRVGKTDQIYAPLAVFDIGLQYQVIYRKQIQTVFINS